MNSQALMQLVYCSRNCILGGSEYVTRQVASIPDASRRNNASLGITGALLFDGTAFTQVLEGPAFAVEQTFEKLQLDPRHSDITILGSNGITERSFSSWSMAFAGPETLRTTYPGIGTILATFRNQTAKDTASILSLMQRLIVRQDDWLPLHPNQAAIQ